MSVSNTSLQSVLTRHLDNLSPNDAQFVQRVYADGIEKYINRLKAIKFCHKNTILDAGCGFGQWSLALSTLNKRVFACDVSRHRVSFVQDFAYQSDRKNIEVYVSSLDSLPFASSSIDAIFCYGVIFLTPWRQTLKELRRVLKPGGTLYVSANGLGWYINLWIKEHNKTIDYDPKKIAAKTMEGTLQYDRRNIYMKGCNLIINQNDLVYEMKQLEFNNIIIAGEGRILLDNSIELPVPFFCNTYYGLPGVFETIGTVTADNFSIQTS